MPGRLGAELLSRSRAVTFDRFSPHCAARCADLREDKGRDKEAIFLIGSRGERSSETNRRIYQRVEKERERER